MTIFRVHTTKGQADIYNCCNIQKALNTLYRMIEGPVTIVRVECMVDVDDWVDVTEDAIGLQA